MSQSTLLIRLLFFISLLICPALLYSQYVSGTITDENKTRMPYASIYVKESIYGTTSDQKGNYFLELKPGSYTLVYSFIGYEAQEIDIELKANQPSKLDVQLQIGTTQLHEVEIVANTRDRAKEIMKEVRDNRKYYLSRVASYECDTYMKTSLEKQLMRPGKNDTIPQIDSLAEPSKNAGAHFQKENLNLIESVSRSYFKNPGKYKEVVSAYHDYAEHAGGDGTERSISVSGDFEVGGPDIAPVQYEADNPYLLFDDLSKCDFNFYSNLIEFDAVSRKPFASPIAGNSALYYKFDFDGSFYENEQKIYKIYVTPLFKQEALFSGTIFIEDSTWALRSVDLSVDNSSLYFCQEFNIIQNYQQIEEGVYLPVRRELNYTIRDGRHDVMGNTRADHSNYIVNPEFENSFFGNEIKRYEPLAFDQDSLFWAERRPLTLKESELQFILESDSISAYFVSDEYYRKTDSVFNKLDFWTPLVGYGHRNRVRGNEFYIEGLLGQVNPFGVGGYVHRLPMYFNKTFDNDFLLETDTRIDYGFKNNDLKGKAGLGLTYVPKKFVRTFIRAGDFYDMVNDYASIEQTFSRSNYVRTKMGSIAQRMEIINGLFAELTFEYSDQAAITNLQLSDWSNFVFGELNEPMDFERYTKSEVRLEVKYRPKQKYIIKRNQKIIIGTDAPEFTLKYKLGIPDLFNSEVKYNYIELGASDEMQLARMGSFLWSVNAGTYINKEDLRVLEYKYFRGSDRYFFSDPSKSFQLLGPTMSTPDEFFSAHYIHHFEGVLLNKVPLLNRLKLSLAAGGGTLLIPDSDFSHFEMFAGVEKVVRIKKQLFRFSVYGVTADNSFESADYSVKFGINFFNTFTNKWDY